MNQNLPRQKIPARWRSRDVYEKPPFFDSAFSCSYAVCRRAAPSPRITAIRQWPRGRPDPAAEWKTPGGEIDGLAPPSQHIAHRPEFSIRRRETPKTEADSLCLCEIARSTSRRTSGPYVNSEFPLLARETTDPLIRTLRRKRSPFSLNRSIAGKRPANPIWREFSGGVNSDSLIAQKFQGVSNESTGRVIQ